jgi:hypothetical protein
MPFREALTRMSNYGSAHKYVKLQRSQICQITKALTKYAKLRKPCAKNQIPEALTNMLNYGSAHKYAKLRKRSQICKLTEALINMPKVGSAYKYVKLRKRSQICQNTEELTNTC